MNSLTDFSPLSAKQHILCINYYFPPMGGGGVQRITKFLKYLDYDRFDVTVLTVRPSFFYTEDTSLTAEIPDTVKILRSESLDPFRLMHLFRKFFRRRSSERENNLRYESSGRARKLAMSIFVPDSRVMWLPFALWKLWRWQRHHKVHCLIASMPPFTSGLIGILARRLLKIPTILDFRDAWTDNPYLPPISKMHGFFNQKLERYCLRHGEGFIFVNPALQKYYQAKYPQLANRQVQMIRNGYDKADFPREISGKKSGEPFELGIMGTIYSQGNRPISLIVAISELLKTHPGLKERFRLTFLGKWAPEFAEWVAQQGIGGVVTFLPYLPHREALMRAAKFDALALSIESELPGSVAVTPGRIYEYLGLQKPILAMCHPESDLTFLVKTADAGEAIAYEDIASIKKVLMEWIENQANIQGQYQFTGIDEYERSHQAGELMNFLGRFQKEQRSF